MDQYRVDVRQIVDEIGGSIHAADTIEMDELVVGDEHFTMREPVRFDVNISNAGEALVSTGRVTAAVKATCSRCLCEFDTEITGEVEGYWLRPGDTPPGDDVDVTGSVDGEGRIDLSPALEAALVIEAPFKPLHDEECAGLCAQCGADLNDGQCECDREPAPEGPFSALKDMMEGKPDVQGGG